LRKGRIVLSGFGGKRAVFLAFFAKSDHFGGTIRGAQTFAEAFIAQAETRAEKLGSNLGVMAAVFYFMPFGITVLTVVGVPLINTISGT
jgi:hypothetical protein